MSKKGQHHGDAVDAQRPRGHEHSRGPNNPSKSVEITTGSYKKPETYEAQVRAGEDPDRPAQHDKNEWQGDVRPATTNQGATRYGHHAEEHRGGSDSNADAGTRGH